jgi:Iap family predicted aminopeptidase
MKTSLWIMFLGCIFAISIAAQPEAEPTSGPVFSTKEAIDASIKAVPCDTSKRLEGVKKLFSEAGAKDDDIKIEKFDKDKISNLVVRKQGKTDETVVIGAHYDRTDSGCGVTDNWSGITILAHMYGTMKSLDTSKSYIFAAFDREEEGLKGSREMLKAMEATDREKICSMINLDSFGQAYPMSLRNASSPKMVDLAESLAKENKMTFNSVTIEGASSDSQSFKDKKIPAITLSGLGADWTKILHSPNDKVEKVNVDSVYLGYRFGLLYLSKIDAAGCRDFK